MSDAVQNTPAPAATVAPQESQSIENTEETSELEAAEGEESSEENESLAEAPKKEEKKSNKKKLRIKVDSKEEDIELDLDNEDELRKHLQLSRVSQKRMSEMSELKKDVTDLLTKLSADPFSVLADPESGLGMNMDDLVKQYVEKRLVEMDKSPEQVAKEQMEAEIKLLREKEANRETERSREKYEAALQNEIIKYDNMMTKALENSEFKKPTPYLVKKMSDYMLLGLENNIDITPEDILPLVREEISSEIRELINSAPEDVIEAMFGKEIFTRMRKKHVAKAKQAPVHASSIKDAGEKGKDAKPIDKVAYKKYFGF